MHIPSAQELEPIASKHDLKLIVLFGSQANGRTHPASDVDIAILPAHRLSWEDRNELWARLCQLFQAEEGEQWAWANFKLYARRLYWDTAPLRQSLSRYLDRRVEDMRHAG